MNKKEIERIWNVSRNEDFWSSHSINKYSFQTLLTGIKIKLIGKKGENAIKQLAEIDRMEFFLERLTFMNCIGIFQAKSIVSMERRIIILEQEKEGLINEIEKNKKIGKW